MHFKAKKSIGKNLQNLNLNQFLSSYHQFRRNFIKTFKKHN